MRGDDQLFGQFLLDAGLVTRSQLDALREDERPLSRVLIDSGVMGEDEVRRACAHSLGVPFVVVDPYDIPLEALVLIPEPLSRARNVVAFGSDEGSVHVALLDLADLDTLLPLRASHFGGRKLVAHFTTRDSLKRALIKYQKHLKEKFGELLVGGVHMVEALVGHALYSKAGGAHVDLGTQGALVRYQVGHALHEAMRLPSLAGRTLVAQLKVMAKLLPVARPQTGKFKLEKDGETTHVQVSTTPTVDGERVHIRFARAAHGQRGHTLESLGFHGENLSALDMVLARRKGLVVVCGKEGSGKSTLLHTLVDLVQHPGVSVAVVEEQGGVSVAAALRGTLKQHPDVVVINDVQNAEVAWLAAAAAARGIFVLVGTENGDMLPQADAVVRVGLVRRLATNQFANMAPLSRAESEVLEQAADPDAGVGVNFRKVYEALKEENIIDPGVSWKDVAFARPTPSTEHPNGYSGNVGLQEVAAPGFETLNIVEDALFKAAQGLTSVEEAVRAAGE